MATEPKGHHWKFVRSGGLDQVVLKSGADIANLSKLDQKLWVALACPTRGIEIDPATLDLIDTDKDGRVRVPEVLASVSWLQDVLKDLGSLLSGGESVPLAVIRDATPAGAALLAGAKRVLASHGRADATDISLADITATEKIFDAKNFNGDGVVPAASAPDPALAKAIEDIISTHGSMMDRSGKPGVDEKIVAKFFEDATALAAWHERGQSPEVAAIAKAAQAVAAIRAKVDDYFARCQISALDDRAAGLLGATEGDLQALSNTVLSSTTAELARLPLARIAAGRPLPLADGLNPAWTAQLHTLATDAAAPILGSAKSELSESEWTKLVAHVAPHRDWVASKPLSAAEALGIERVRELRAAGTEAALQGLIAQDRAVEKEFEQLDAVEKLVRFQRDFIKLLTNFVNFSAFYAKAGAVFQAGTLYLDGRSCNLCVRVADPAKHAVLAALAKTYLAYCDCVRRGTGEIMTIAAAFTDGDSDNLMVGRNGIFYDRKGNDWDATITKVIENPISIRQAFFAPYKRFVRLLEEQIAKRAAAADVSAGTKLQSAAQQVATADQGAPAPAKAEATKFDLALITGIGVAIGSIGAFVSTLLGKFFDLGRWVPLGLVGVMLAISGPSMLIAWLKLRQRNLGPILDANGWAINGRVHITVPFGGALTDVASLPPGSERSLVDPYAEKRRPWKLYCFLVAVLVLAVGWYAGRLDHYLPAPVKSTTVLGSYAPAADPAK